MGSIQSSHLLDLVGRIYDCVLAPEKWEPTIASMQDTFGWHNVVLGVYSFLNNGTQFQVALGIPEEYGHIIGDPSYLPDVFALWGGKNRIDAAPLEEPVLQSLMSDPKAWVDNRYFRNFVKPQGIVDAVSIGLARDSSMIATLTGGRHGSFGPVTDEELAGLRVIAPHLRRAVTIANLFDNFQSRNEMLSEALETSRAGIILIDGQLTILHANGHAQEMLDSGNPIRTIDGRLALREEAAQSALTAAVAAGQEKPGGRGAGIPTRCKDGSTLLLHTFPLKGRNIRQGAGMPATTAVVLATSPGPVDLDSENFALQYDLTPAELRVVKLAIEGLSMAKAAESLGVAPSTVKTHLLRVFEKTGTHRQAELMALARSFYTSW